MMRPLLLAFYGLAVGVGYAAAVDAAMPGESPLLPVRGLNMVLLMTVYGWCCGKDPLLPLQRPLIELPLFPLVLLGAAVAICLFLLSFAATRLLRSAITMKGD